MHKMLIFDLDGTLAPVGRGMLPENIQKLQLLEKLGYTIAICSGKCCTYLCGFARQLNLQRPILLGEQGCVLQHGIDYPPEEYHIHPCSDRAKAQLKLLRQRLDAVCGDRCWYQANELEVTPFTRDEQVMEQIQGVVDAHPEDMDELAVFRYDCCYDILPKTINKASSLQWLADMTGYTSADFIAVGDYINDIPMFEFADVSILIGDQLELKTDLRFPTIGEALDHLIRNTLPDTDQSVSG